VRIGRPASAHPSLLDAAEVSRLRVVALRLPA
jgi:hypothetical protein